MLRDVFVNVLLRSNSLTKFENWIIPNPRNFQFLRSRACYYLKMSKSGITLSDVHVDVGGDVEVKLTKGHDLELGLSWDCKCHAVHRRDKDPTLDIP